MISLEKVRLEYDRLDKLLGIDTTHLHLSTFKKPGAEVAACISTETAWPFAIQFNMYYMPSLPELDIVDVMRHEYAHAAASLLSGKLCGHNSFWQEICLKVGCRPSPYTYNLSVIEDLTGTQKRDEQDYSVECLRCKDVTYHSKESRMVAVLKMGRMSWNYACGKCGGMMFRLLDT